MATIYILEGADRVGKSSLAQAFSHQSRIPLVHFSTPNKQIQKELGHYYQYDILLTKPLEDIILDRSWVSDLFYDMFRRQQSPAFKAAMQLEHALVCRGYQLEYIFVHREWGQKLWLEHLREIRNMEGYGDFKQRKLEHFNWPHLFEKWTQATQGNCWVLNSDYFEQNLDQLLAYQDPTNEQYKQQIRPSANSVSNQLSDILKSQAKASARSVVWAQYDWLNVDTSRVERLLEGISQAGY